MTKVSGYECKNMDFFWKDIKHCPFVCVLEFITHNGLSALYAYHLYCNSDNG